MYKSCIYLSRCRLITNNVCSSRPVENVRKKVCVLCALEASVCLTVVSGTVGGICVSLFSRVQILTLTRRVVFVSFRSFHHPFKLVWPGKKWSHPYSISPPNTSLLTSSSPQWNTSVSQSSTDVSWCVFQFRDWWCVLKSRPPRVKM